MSPSTSSTAGPPPGGEPPPAPPEWPSSPRLSPWGLVGPGLDQLGLTQAFAGLILGLLVLIPSYDTSPSGVVPSPSSGASPSSLPRWRQCLSMLNWRRDPDHEQRKIRHALRRKELESEILRVRNDSEQIENESEEIEKESEQIENDIERLRRENARLRMLNAKTRHLISCVDQLCFPPESSSTPPPATESNCGPSSP